MVMRSSFCASCHERLDAYAPDCHHCGAHVEQDGDDHHDREVQVHRDRAGHAVEVHRKWKLHVPWGLFVILAVYTGAAFAYVTYTDQNSPQAVAQTHLLAAQQILGPDNGDTARDADLLVAYQHLIDALTLTPEDAWGHQQLERVSWALAKRGQKPPAELKRRADFLSASWASIQAGRASNLPEGPRERFGLDAIGDSAGRLKRYLGFGGVVIMLLWIYREFQDYKFLHKRDDEHELLRREELRSLNAHRKR